MPALLIRISSAAETLGGGAHDLRTAVVPGDVGEDAEEALAGAAVFGRRLGLLERRRVELDRGDAGAGVEQSERHRPAEPAPGAGDDGDFPSRIPGHARSCPCFGR